ncbi:MAG: ATP-binding protein, partial [Candidatus Margulisbacteria bacterium]|nr:ATP-binding protein [Candidatus Margulisiibacteriota bacterium]
MNWDDILILLEQGEGQSIEFEKFVPSPEDIARDMVAFSNSDGGRIVYGIDDKNKHLLGVNSGDDLESMIATIAKENCSPKLTPEVELVNKGGKGILIITVVEGDEKPYKTDDICYI